MDAPFSNMDKEDSSDDLKERHYYSIRLLITHPVMLASEITAALGMEPTRSWNPGDRHFTKSGAWSHTSWTEGQRLFFDEVHDVLAWLHEKQEFVLRLLSSGGELHVIAQLPGSINIGSNIKLETLALASKLGITLGVEVFPNMPRPDAREP